MKDQVNRKPMRSHFAKMLWGGGVFATSMLMSAVFQNCSAAHLMTSDAASTVDMPLNHPSDINSNLLPAQARLVVGDLDFVTSVFSDVYLTPSSPGNEVGFFNDRVFNNLTISQHLFGRSCDPIATGDSTVCYFHLGNRETKLGAASSSGREAARVQLCRDLGNNETMLAAAYRKISVDIGTQAPSADSAAAIIRQYYPALNDTVVTEFAARLLDIDGAMAQQSERIQNRWKLLMITVCETSGWEIL